MRLIPLLKLAGLAAVTSAAIQVLRWGWPDTPEATLASWSLTLLVGALWIRGQEALEGAERARKGFEEALEDMLDARDKLEVRFIEKERALVLSLQACQQERAHQAQAIERQRKDLAKLLVTPAEVLQALESRGSPSSSAFVTAWQHSDDRLRKVLAQSALYRGLEAELLARKLNIYRGTE